MIRILLAVTLVLTMSTIALSQTTDNGMMSAKVGKASNVEQEIINLERVLKVPFKLVCLA